MRSIKRYALLSLTLVPSVTIAISAGTVSMSRQHSDPTREAIISAGASELCDTSQSWLLSTSALHMWRLNLDMNNPAITHVPIDSCAYIDCVELKYIRDCRRKTVMVYQRKDGTWAQPYLDVMCSSK